MNVTNKQFKVLSSIKMFLFGLMALSATGLRAGWVVERPEESSFGYWNSISIDSNGNPHASYRDSSSGGNIRYVKRVGGVWTGENIQTGLTSTDGHISIALSSSDVPWVSYFLSGTGVMVASRGASGWTAKTVDPQGNGYTSLKIDASGNAHLSYQANGLLKYAKWDGVAWSTYTIDSLETEGLWTSLALDPSLKPLISYYDPKNKDLKIAKWNTQWSTETIVSSGNVGIYSSLVVDPAGHPMVSFVEPSVGVKLAKWTGTGWDVQSVWRGSALFTSLALDSQNNPTVAFGGSSLGVRISRHNEGVWSLTALGKMSGDYCSLATRGEHTYVAFGTTFFDVGIFNPLDAPLQITGLAISTNTIHWKWSDNAINETGVRVLRASDNFPLLVTLPANTTYWIETGLIPNAHSQVVVEAFHSSASVRSVTASAYTNSAPPVNTRIQSVDGGKVSIAWDSSGNSTDTFYTAEYRSQYDGSFSRFYEGKDSTATFVSLLANTRYYFRVKSKNQANISSAYDLAVSTVTSNFVPWPPVAELPQTTTSTIVWTWSDQSNNENGFRVRSATDSRDLSGLLPPNTLSWTQTGLTQATSYQIYIEAFNDIGVSSSTSIVRFTSALPPTNVVVIPSTGASLDLRWLANEKPETVTYKVDYSQNSSFYSFSSTNSTVPWVRVSSLFGSTTYYARVYAINGDKMPSFPSSTVSYFVPLQPPDKPPRPYTNFVSTGTLNWTWSTGFRDPVTGYRVYNADTGLPLSGELTPSTIYNYWSQTNMGPNQPSRIFVAAFNNVGTTSSDPSIAYTLSQPPVGTAAEPVETNTVALRWLDNGNSTSTVYHVEKSFTSGGPFSFVSSGPVTNVRVSDLMDGATNYFRVRAQNGGSSYSLYDSTVSAFVPASTPPPAPMNLDVLSRSTNTITWGWTDGSAKEQGFRVFRDSDSQILETLAANTTYWVQTGLFPNSRSKIQVEAFNDFGESRTNKTYYSSEYFTLSNPPGEIHITDVTPNSVLLSWADNGNPDNTDYRFYVSKDGGAYGTYVYPDHRTYSTVQGLQQGATYSFKVTALNKGYNPESDALVIVSTTIPFGPPSRPDVDTSHYNRTTTSITWKWTKSVNATGYMVYRDSDNVLLSGSLAADSSEWVQFGLGVGSRETVRIEAFNAYGSSSTVYNDSSMPNPPINTRVKGVTSTSADLSWEPNGNPSYGEYEVQFSSTDWITQSNSWVFGETSTTLPELLPNTTYSFRVRAMGFFNSYYTRSTFDQPVTVYLESGPPPAPKILSVIKSTSSIQWGWKDSPNETGYRVLRTSDSFDLTGDLPAGTTSFVLNNLAPGEAIRITIHAFNSFGSNSTPSEARTFPLPPTDLRVTGSGSSNVQLAWDGNGNSANTYYELHLGTVPDSVSLGKRYINGNETSVLNLISGTTYYFKVGSWNGTYGDPIFFSEVISTVVPFGPPGMVRPSYSSTPNSLTWLWEKVNNASGYRILDSDGNSLSEDLSLDTTSWVKTGLTPGSKFPISIESFNQYGSSRTAVLNYQTDLSPVSNVNFLAVGPTSVTLSWDSNGNPSDAFYYVSVATWSFPTYSDKITYDTENNSSTINDLKPGTTYYFRVDGLSMAYEGRIIVSTVTPNSGRAPIAKTKTNQSIVWEWAQEIPEATGYRFLMAEDQRDLSGRLPASQRTWTLKGLGANSPINVILLIETPYGDILSAPSGPVVTLPNDPAQLRLLATGNNRAMLAWDLNNNPPSTEYLLVRSAPGTDPVEVLVGRTSTATLTGLLPRIQYSISVQAVGFSGRSKVTGLVNVALNDPVQFDLGGDGWTLEMVDNEGTQSGEYLTMDLDSQGTPHLFYSSGNGRDLKTAKREMGRWFFDVLQPNANIMSPMSLDVDDQDHFYLNYENGLRLQSLVIEEKSILTQREVPMDSFTDGSVHLSVNGQGFQGSAVRIRANGESVIAYGLSVSADKIGGNTGYYQFYEAVRPGGASLSFAAPDEEDSLWKKKLIASIPIPIKNEGFGSDSGEIDLALDSEGVSHVVFFHCRDREDFPNALGDIVYARRVGDTWVTEVVESQVATEDSSVSIAVDPENKVHVLYLDNAHLKVRHAVRTASGWEINSLEENKAKFYSFTQLSVDGSGRLHAVYLAVTDTVAPVNPEDEEKYTSTLRYALNNKGPWTVETIESGDDMGFHPCLAVDPLGNAHVAYRAGDPHRLKYASKNSRAFRVERTVPKEGTRIVLNGTRGQTVVTVLPDTFENQVDLTIGAPDVIPQAQITANSYIPSGIALEILASPNTPPQKPVQIKFPFNRSELRGINVGSLILAQYNEFTGEWDPLLTRLDPASNNLTAMVNRWGTVQIMYQSVGSSVGETVAFPNPMRPGKAGYETVTFDRLPLGSTLKIFTFRGELVRELNENGNGQAQWDGKNLGGSMVASGVYLVRIEGTGGEKIIKVMVQR